MKPVQYVALLRGINVGGKNIVPMASLKAAFTSMGLGDIATYIQSGNVLFTSDQQDIAALTTTIEAALEKAFRFAIPAVVITGGRLERTVDRAPDGFGAAPDVYRYDVLFLKPPLTATKALKDVPVEEGVDRVHPGTDVIYFSRLIAKASQSRLSRITQMPVYRQMTIRNWNTTTKLLALIRSRG